MKEAKVRDRERRTKTEKRGKNGGSEQRKRRGEEEMFSPSFHLNFAATYALRIHTCVKCEWLRLL